MPHTIRSRNLDLIRWLYRGHENTAKLLSPVANSNYISQMATGDREISDQEARSIEKYAELPADWLDRDNIAILKMTSTESQIHQMVKALPEHKQVALLKLLAPENQ